MALVSSPAIVHRYFAIGAFPQNFSIALDDYHRIKTQSIHEGLNFLLDHLPENMRVILTARADPPLPLARFRARNHLMDYALTICVSPPMKLQSS